MSRPARAAAIDRRVLDGLRRDVGDETVATLIELFIEDTARILDELRRAVSGRNGDDAVMPAHTLKSTSATLGAFELSAACGDLEAAALDGARGEALKRRVVTVARRCEAARRALERELSKLAVRETAP